LNSSFICFRLFVKPSYAHFLGHYVVYTNQRAEWMSAARPCGKGSATTRYARSAARLRLQLRSLPKILIVFSSFHILRWVFCSFPHPKTLTILTSPKTVIRSDLISYDKLFSSFFLPNTSKKKTYKKFRDFNPILPQTFKLRYVRLQWEYSFTLMPKVVWFSRISQDC